MVLVVVAAAVRGGDGVGVVGCGCGGGGGGGGGGSIGGGDSKGGGDDHSLMCNFHLTVHAPSIAPPTNLRAWWCLEQALNGNLAAAVLSQKLTRKHIVPNPFDSFVVTVVVPHY